MSFKYNLTVTEILKKIDYTKTKDNILNDQQKGIVLPAVLMIFCLMQLLLIYFLYLVTNVNDWKIFGL